MSRFLHRLAWFAAVAAALWAAGEWQAHRMYRGDSDLGFKAQVFYESGCPYQTIVLGSSWAEESIIPSRLEGGGFNLGYPVQDVYYGSELLRQVVLPRCPGLRRVIIAVGYAYFDWDLFSDWQNDPLPVDYARDFGIAAPGGWPAALRNVNYVRHLSLLYATRQRFVFDLLGLRTPGRSTVSRDSFALPPRWGEETILADGYRFSSRAIAPADVEADAAEEVRLRYVGWRTPRVESNLRILADTLDLLNARGIKVLLMVPPYTGAYRRRIPAEYREGFARSMAELMSRCRNDEVEYRDYSDSQAFTADMFRNSDHLNYRGAMLLTSLLDQPRPRPGGQPGAPVRLQLTQVSRPR